MDTQDIYGFSVNDIKGNSHSLEEFKNKVLLIVNTASKCGFTPQFKGLQALYDEFGKERFEILGFPCNQFLKQDPESDSSILEFCELNYGVSFPMFGKIDVNGSHAHPLFGFLKSKAKGILGSQAIKWNFTKFLVDSSGRVIKRYGPRTKPERIRSDIARLLENERK